MAASTGFEPVAGFPASGCIKPLYQLDMAKLVGFEPTIASLTVKCITTMLQLIMVADVGIEPTCDAYETSESPLL